MHGGPVRSGAVRSDPKNQRKRAATEKERRTGDGVRTGPAANLYLSRSALDESGGGSLAVDDGDGDAGEEERHEEGEEGGEGKGRRGRGRHDDGRRRRLREFGVAAQE